MFSPNWKRPSSIEYPKVWHRFEKTNKDGKTIKFKVQDLTEDYHDKLFELLVKDYIKSEIWALNSKMGDDPESMEIFKKFYEKEVMPQKISLICLEDDDNQSGKNIVGYNFLGVCQKDCNGDLDEFVKTQCGRDLTTIYKFFMEKCPDLYEKYKIDTYLSAIGLCVNSDYRGMSISAEILKTRIPLCKALGIKITNTIFTGTASQKCAAKAGFEEDVVVSYDEFRAFTGFEFKNCVDCKMMTLRID